MISVVFHDVDAFLTELERDAAAAIVDRGIVRVTPVYRRSQLGLQHVTVRASYVSAPHGPDSAPWLVEAHAYAGDLWGHADKDAEVEERRDGLVEAVTAGCARLGLDVRAGWFGAIT